MNILSLGAGVQSSTMALMAAYGEIEPMPDCAIFADTAAEPKHVYDQLDFIQANVPFPVYRVMEGEGRTSPYAWSRRLQPVIVAIGQANLPIRVESTLDRKCMK